jgi:hypothetical protein
MMIHQHAPVYYSSVLKNYCCQVKAKVFHWDDVCLKEVKLFYSSFAWDSQRQNVFRNHFIGRHILNLEAIRLELIV